MNDNMQSVFAESLLKTNLSEKQRGVLRAGLTLFSTKGFDNTSTKDIAKMAGVAEGTVYQQFKNKKGILNAILDPFISFVIPKIAKDFVYSVSSIELNNVFDFFKSIIKNRIAFIIKNEEQINILIQEILKSPALVNKITEQLVEISNGEIATRIKYFQNKKEIVDLPVEKIIQYMISTVAGFMLPIVIKHEKNISEEKIDQWSIESTKFLLNGISKHHKNS